MWQALALSKFYSFSSLAGWSEGGSTGRSHGVFFHQLKRQCSIVHYVYQNMLGGSIRAQLRQVRRFYPSWHVGHLSSLHKNIFNASIETLKGFKVPHIHSLLLQVCHTLMFLNPVKHKSWDNFSFQLPQPCHCTFHPLLILFFLESYLNLSTLPMELLHSASFACQSNCFVVLFLYSTFLIMLGLALIFSLHRHIPSSP